MSETLEPALPPELDRQAAALAALRRDWPQAGQD